MQMKRSTIGRAVPLCAPFLAGGALALSGASQASSATTVGPPVVSTGKVTHVRGTSAQLEGTLDPNGAATTYFFKYGPTPAYGSTTTPASLPPGFSKVKVGQTVTRFLPGYHYRLVASNSHGTREGNDRVFTVKSSRLQFQIPKHIAATTFGASFVLRGALSGSGSANHRIVLQASPFPYLTPFADVGLPTVTDAAGRFSFRVPKLLSSTQFRVSTLDPRPLYSRLVTEQVAVRVTLKVRSTRRRGLVRLYGEVTPAEERASVMFQVRKAVRPGKSEKSTRFSSQFSTVVKHGTKTISRFSVVERIHRAGSYRAFVHLVHKGPVVSGSSETVVLHAAAAAPSHKAHRKKR
jgi:hypothetical protein